MIEGRKDILDKSPFMIEPFHRENGGTLGMGTLNNERHIKLVVRGYLLDPNPLLKGRFLGEFNSGPGPPSQGCSHHFPYDLLETWGFL